MSDQMQGMPPGAGDDRRRHNRVPVRVEAIFRDGEDLISSYLFNISQGGLLVRSETPLELGTEVVLQFRLPGLDHHFAVLGQVIWKMSPEEGKASGMGVAFVDMGTEDREMLQRYISEQLAG